MGERRGSNPSSCGGGVFAHRTDSSGIPGRLSTIRGGLARARATRNAHRSGVGRAQAICTWRFPRWQRSGAAEAERRTISIVRLAVLQSSRQACVRVGGARPCASTSRARHFKLSPVDRSCGRRRPPRFFPTVNRVLQLYLRIHQARLRSITEQRGLVGWDPSAIRASTVVTSDEQRTESRSSPITNRVRLRDVHQARPTEISPAGTTMGSGHANSREITAEGQCGPLPSLRLQSFGLALTSDWQPRKRHRHRYHRLAPQRYCRSAHSEGRPDVVGLEAGRGSRGCSRQAAQRARLQAVQVRNTIPTQRERTAPTLRASGHPMMNAVGGTTLHYWAVGASIRTSCERPRGYGISSRKIDGRGPVRPRRFEPSLTGGI